MAGSYLSIPSSTTVLFFKFCRQWNSHHYAFRQNKLSMAVPQKSLTQNRKLAFEFIRRRPRYVSFLMYLQLRCSDTTKSCVWSCRPYCINSVLPFASKNLRHAKFSEKKITWKRINNDVFTKMNDDLLKYVHNDFFAVYLWQFFALFYTYLLPSFVKLSFLSFFTFFAHFCLFVIFNSIWLFWFFSGHSLLPCLILPVFPCLANYDHLRYFPYLLVFPDFALNMWVFS